MIPDQLPPGSNLWKSPLPRHRRHIPPCQGSIIIIVIIIVIIVINLIIIIDLIIIITKNDCHHCLCRYLPHWGSRSTPLHLLRSKNDIYLRSVSMNKSINESTNGNTCSGLSPASHLVVSGSRPGWTKWNKRTKK